MNKKMKYPIVSIIVPCYKVEKFLRNCIESVIRQPYIHWELILVDDGSPDNCGAICDEYAAIDDRIKVIHKPNGGVASARNEGVAKAMGEYICFVDGDDYLHVDFLKKMITLATENNADLVQCGCVKGSEFQFPQIPEGRISHYSNHTVFTSEVANIVVWGKLYKREVVADVKIPEGVYFEDDYTTWKYYYKSPTIVLTTEQLYYYYQNPESVMAQHRKKLNLDFLEAYNERIRFFVDSKEADLEHMSRLQQLKACVLSYTNAQATSEQKKLLLSTFRDSWKVLKGSKHIKKIYKILFIVFSISPTLGSKLANKVR